MVLDECSLTMFLPAVCAVLQKMKITLFLVYISVCLSTTPSTTYREVMLRPRPLCRCRGYDPQLRTVLLIFTT